MWKDSSRGPRSLAGLPPAAFSRLLRLPRKGCRRSPCCPGSSGLSSYAKHSFVKEKEGGWKSLGCLGEEQQRIKSRHLQCSGLRPPPLTLPRATSPGLVAHLLVPGRAAWWDARAEGATQGFWWLLVTHNLHQVTHIYIKYVIYISIFPASVSPPEGTMLFPCPPCCISVYTQGSIIITNAVIKTGCSKLYCLPNPY